ncbi:MAG: DUF4157 domain-containing protein [Candidatus Hodarchaeota archaeon]
MFAKREIKQQIRGPALISQKRTSVRADSARPARNSLESTHFLQRNLGNSYLQSLAENRKTVLRKAVTNGKLIEIPPIVHNVLRSPGQPLAPSIRYYFEPRFGHDFSNVRVHADDHAALSVASFNTRAYTVGNHIAFGPGQFMPSTSKGRELLFHELIHVTQNQEDNRSINFWNKDEHHKLTRQIVDFYRLNPHSPSIMRDPLFGSEQFYRIINSSFNMDVTGKRILWTGPQFVLGITKGEGPEHGENGNYSHGNIDEARKQNINLQKAYVKKSLDFYKKEKGQIRRIINKKIQVTPNVEAMFKALGDACHIAQDRGAHWEGTKGMGHDDPRAKKGTWDTDSPADNIQGYENARKNTYDVFKMWAWETTISIGYDWG